VGDDGEEVGGTVGKKWEAMEKRLRRGGGD